MGALNKLLKNTAVLLASNLITKGLSALFIIFLANYLEDFGFGQYKFAFSFAAVFIIFSDMGLDALTIRNVARDRTLAGHYLESVGLLRLGLSLIMIAISLAAGIILKLDGYLLLVILVAGLAYLFDKLSGLYYALFRAHERMELEAGVQILWKIVQIGLGFGAIYFQFSLLGIMLVLLVSSVVKNIVGFSLMSSINVIPNRGVLRQRNLVRDALPFAGYEIGNAIYMNISVIFLFILQSPEDTGWFSAALSIIMFMLLLPSAFDAALYPLFSKLYSNSLYDMNFAFGKSIKYSLLAAIPIAVIIAIMSNEIAGLFGSGFSNTAQCLVLLAAVLPLYTLNMLMKSALWSADAQTSISWNIWIAFVVLAIASYILIEKDGYAGAAFALIIGESSFFLLNYLAVKKKGFPIGHYLWKPIAGGLGMLGLFFGLDFIFAERLSALYIAAIVLAFYIFMILSMGTVTKAERIMLRDAISPRKP